MLHLQLCSASALHVTATLRTQTMMTTHRNKKILLPTNLVVKGIWWNIKSVLFEELIFRGVLLYILIKKTGFSKGIIISAIVFGIYHWFSFEIIGNIPQMTLVFFITGIMGLLLAYAYGKTLSLYIPIAIHLGWNFTQGFIFSDGPIGNGIFITTNGQFRTDSYFIYFIILLVPMISAWLINYFLLKRRKQVELSVYTLVKTPEVAASLSRKT